MTLRTNLLLLVFLPIAGLLGIFILGISGFRTLRWEIPRLNSVQRSRSYILSGDRDAYQAFLEERKIIGSVPDWESLGESEDIIRENMQQTWDRVAASSEDYSEDMFRELVVFKEKFAAWEELNLSIREDTQAVAANEMERLASSREAEAAFTDMRVIIDEVTGLIEEQLKRNLSERRKNELVDALSLCLNGDRDAYQASLAQIQASEAMSLSVLEELDAINEENIGQTQERVSEAGRLLGTAAGDHMARFGEIYPYWSEKSRLTLKLSLDNFRTLDHIRNTSLESDAVFQEMRGSLDRLGDMQDERVKVMTALMDSRLIRLSYTYSIVVTVSIAAALLASLIISRIILTKLGHEPAIIAEIAENVANGNLVIDTSLQKKKDSGVYSSMKRMTEHLTSVLEEIHGASYSIAETSRQVNELSHQFAEGVAEQASSVEEVAASLEEMASTLDQSADNSSTTKDIAARSAKEITQGKEAVAGTLEAMKDIAERAAVIGEIARNTDMLALNASIEAARAGEYGKGFAVVAQEVRQLAERTQQAAGQIDELVSGSLGRAEKANVILNTLAPDIQETARLVEEIHVSDNQQRLASAQVNSAVNQLSTVIETNSSSSEEMASIAERMDRQAGILQQQIAFFQTDESPARRIEG